MSRIFVLVEDTSPSIKSDAPTKNSDRAAMFSRKLHDAGHEVWLAEMPRPEKDDENHGVDEWRKIENISRFRFPAVSEALLSSMLERELEHCKPDALLGIDSFAGCLLCRAPVTLPIWCDLNDSSIGAEPEIVPADQALAQRYAWSLGYLRRADFFSVLTLQQSHTLLGQLAMVGRLNRFTFQHEFATIIPRNESTDARMAPLLNWAEQPKLAPDNEQRLRIRSGADQRLTQRPMNSIEERYAQLERTTMRDLLQARQELQALRGRSLYRLGRKVKHVLGGRFR